MSDCKDLQYVVNSVSSMEKKISALLSIVSNAQSILYDEVKTSKDALKGGMDTKILLSDALDNMRYNYEDLEAYHDFMCSVLEEMRQLVKRYGKKDNDND